MLPEASSNEFGKKLGQCYITDAAHVWLSDWVGIKKILDLLW